MTPPTETVIKPLGSLMFGLLLEIAKFHFRYFVYRKCFPIMQTHKTRGREMKYGDSLGFVVVDKCSVKRRCLYNTVLRETLHELRY